MRHLDRLLCKINAVTSKHRHGLPIPKKSLDALSIAQIDYEESANTEQADIIYGVMKKLIGSIKPVGDVFEDTERLQNAKVFMEVFEMMYSDIDAVLSHTNTREESISSIAKFCKEYLEEMDIGSKSEQTMTRHEKLETIAKLLAKNMFYGDWKWETPNERVLTMLMQDVGLYPFKNEGDMISKTFINDSLYKEAIAEVPQYECTEKFETVVERDKTCKNCKHYGMWPFTPGPCTGCGVEDDTHRNWASK